MQHIKDYWFNFLVLIFGMLVLILHSRAPNFAHVCFSLTAVAILILAAIQAILTALQNYFIKTYPLQNLPLLRNLPPLETMQAVLYQIIWAGFIVLSLAFIGAFLYLPDVWHHIQLSKLLLSILSWSLFATLLYGYHRFGWSSDMVTIRTLFGVLLLIIAYLTSKWIERI